MRALLVLLLSLPAVAGELDRLERTVKELVPLLGSGDASLRDEAARRLLALGEEAIPVLQSLAEKDPEVRRALRALIRRAASLRLQLTAPSVPQRIGAPLVLKVRLVNNTDETYIVPLVQGSCAGTGTRSGFLVRAGNQKPVRLRPDQVELLTPMGRTLILQPEATLRLALTLTGADSPLRRPGKTSLSVLYNAKGLARALLGGGRRKVITELHAAPDVTLESGRVVVEARGRKPAELDAAMRSGDRPTFLGALAELKLREDDAVLPLLRRHVRHPLLRRHAVRRLGAAARPQDLDLLRAIAGRDAEPKNVRLTAIAALGNYKVRSARLRLVALAQDLELREAAVTALAGHRSANTIDCFVRLLQRNYHEGPWVKRVLDTLLDWTDKHVENRRSEIDAFERWWRNNRASWITLNR